MTTKVDVISLGTGELGPQAKERLIEAAVVIGSQRQLDLVQQYCPQANRVLLPSPISELARLLDNLNASPVAVLASGDGLFYGIGSLLIQTLGHERLHFFPNVSSIQVCMHLIGLPWQDATIVSLHGRPMSNLRRHIAPNSLFGIFTDQTNHPADIAKELVAQGLKNATVWIGEALGTDHQKVSKFEASTLATNTNTFDPLNVMVVKTTSTPAALPVFPGIPDHLFSTGAEPGFGMISKREVRLAILSMMQPAPGQIAWDIGAGCGSVCVEWARWNPGGNIYAVESDPARIEHININTNRFGVEQNCHVAKGIAPEQCEKLPNPHVVFIGGSSGILQQLLDYCWNRVAAGGLLVVSAVTESSQLILTSFADQQRQQNNAVEWVEISVQKNLPDSAETRSLQPVQLISCAKP